MTMHSIVQTLADWVHRNAEPLRTQGVKLTKNFPEPGSDHPWKAGIGLEYKDIAVDYTVWEQTIFITELMILNTATMKLTVVEEKYPDDASTVDSDLDEVVAKLVGGIYARMDPDPRWTSF